MENNVWPQDCNAFFHSLSSLSQNLQKTVKTSHLFLSVQMDDGKSVGVRRVWGPLGATVGRQVLVTLTYRLVVIYLNYIYKQSVRTAQ